MKIDLSIMEDRVGNEGTNAAVSTRRWPLWKTDESRLRYYNITPTFILEVKLRVSTWIAHTQRVSSSLLFALAFFFFCTPLSFSDHANFVSLSPSHLLALAFSYFPVTLAPLL